MKILNSLEREAYEVPPQFTIADRKQYFDTPQDLIRIVRGLRNPTNQVCFVISCGYFRATKRFFSGVSQQADIDHVCGKLDFPVNAVDPAAYDRATAMRHRRMILNHYGFRNFGKKASKTLEKEIETLGNSQLKPRLIFFRAVDILREQKISPPSSDALTKLIINVLNRRRMQLIDAVDEYLGSETRDFLDQLLQKATNEKDEPINRYRLTLLKKCSQSTKPGKIKETVEDFQLLKGLHETVRPVLEELKLPYGAIYYYANSVILSEIFQVIRRAEEDRYLHLIAFISHQYFRLQDNLADIFITCMRSAVNTAQREHKDQCYERRERRGESLRNLVEYVDESLVFRQTISQISEDSRWSDSQKLNRVRMLLKKSADRNEPLTSSKIDLEADLSGDEYYTVLEERSLKMQNRATPILKSLTFHAERSSDALMKALDHFKEKDGAVAKNAPMNFLNAGEKAAVCKGNFRVSLYKAFLSLHVKGAIESGRFNLQESYKYRPMEEYLIDKERWDIDKEMLLERAGITAFTDPKKVLSDLDEKLFEQYQIANANIRSGVNGLVSFTKTGTLRVKTPKLEEKDVDPLQELFPEKHYVPLSEVLATVDRHSGFLDEFQHWQQRYNRANPEKKTFIAGVTAIGCDIGLGKILKISREINGGELENTVNWFFYPEGLQGVNDRLLHFMDKLQLANLYRRSPDRLHTSSDGQQFEIRTDSLNANYSFKYSGKTKGVSVHGFIDERHLLFHSQVVSAAERESAWVIDGLMHNDVIKSDIHSTDTHGYTEAIFGTMHPLGFYYAPRIKNLKKQKIYLFKSRQSSDRSEWKIKPSGYVNTKLIEDHWDDILRFITTIKLKETSASDLFRRLNSYSKQHSLYAALKAFGRILKSIFILQYIDDVELRQSIEKQLNKIESSNRFSRAISIGGGRSISQSEKQEQEIAESCKRLVKNAIVCWNYLYLSQKISDQKDMKRRQAWLESIAAGSVVSWRHINLLGEYDFSEEKLKDSFGIKPHENLNLKRA